MVVMNGNTKPHTSCINKLFKPLLLRPPLFYWSPFLYGQCSIYSGLQQIRLVFRKCLQGLRNAARYPPVQRPRSRVSPPPTGRLHCDVAVGGRGVTSLRSPQRTNGRSNNANVCIAFRINRNPTQRTLCAEYTRRAAAIHAQRGFLRITRARPHGSDKWMW